MDFIYSITTPQNTLEAAPLVTPVKLTRGKLVSGWIYFPSDALNNLYFIARIGSHQVTPFNPSSSITLSDCIAPLTFGIELKEPPFIVDLITWNISTTADYYLSVCFALEPIGRRPWNIDKVVNEFAGTQGYSKP